MNRIVSSLPGRIRIRDKRLRDQARLNELKKELLKIAAITELKSDARTGSVVVNFDSNLIEIAALEAKLDLAVDKVLAEPVQLLTKKQPKNVLKFEREKPMQELEDLQHLSTQELELAFRLVENPHLSEQLTENLEGLDQKQWESVGYLLFLLRSAQMRSLVH